MNEAEIAVRRGAELLDRVQPGWYNEIDTEILDISDCVRCVLGQLFHHFSLGTEFLGFRRGRKINGVGAYNDWSKTDEHGFSCDSLWFGSLEELNIGWKQLITERKANAQS